MQGFYLLAILGNRNHWVKTQKLCNFYAVTNINDYYNSVNPATMWVVTYLLANDTQINNNNMIILHN